MSSIDISCSIPVCLTKDGDYETSALLSGPFYSNGYTEPKNMFPPHIRLFSDNEDEPEAQRQPSDSSNTLMNFDPVSRDNHDDILRSVQLLLRNYGKCCLWGNSRVTMCGNSPRTNRIRSLDIFIDDTMSICRKHRCSYGINWYDSKPTCHHSDHNPKHRPSPRDYRRANITICSEIEGFPVEG
ncbi:unnamed protein product, partial [Rotaria magnacalcarata]